MNNPPAFPRTGFAHPNAVLDPMERAGLMNEPQDGMTLRDYFAAAAMQGYCANPSLSEENYKYIADMAVMQADAILKAREQ